PCCASVPNTRPRTSGGAVSRRSATWPRSTTSSTACARPGYPNSLLGCPGLRRRDDARGRKSDRDGRAGVFGAFDRERAAVQLDQPAAERQAEACPLRAPREPAVDLNELLERFWNVLRRHADPVVGHGDRDRPVATAHGGDHPPAPRRELDGV